MLDLFKVSLARYDLIYQVTFQIFIHSMVIARFVYRGFRRKYCAAVSVPTSFILLLPNSAYYYHLLFCHRQSLIHKVIISSHALSSKTIGWGPWKAATFWFLPYSCGSCLSRVRFPLILSWWRCPPEHAGQPKPKTPWHKRCAERVAIGITEAEDKAREKDIRAKECVCVVRKLQI